MHSSSEMFVRVPLLHQLHFQTKKKKKQEQTNKKKLLMPWTSDTHELRLSFIHGNNSDFIKIHAVLMPLKYNAAQPVLLSGYSDELLTLRTQDLKIITSEKFILKRFVNPKQLEIQGQIPSPLLSPIPPSFFKFK